MPTFHTEHKVEHSAKNMFDLVADVEQYPRFVPLCEALVVRGRKQFDDGKEVLIADMTVAYKLFRETFTSRVTLDRGSYEIYVEYLDGPFKHLENTWAFTPLGANSCEIRFHITYEFKSRTLGALMGAMFDRAFSKFSDAFEARADEIYKTA
ncbi:type II toxin-antitoxin system RatA family toxin [Rhizobiales bacterium]|uniref:type II toxin-antitoxin system RatA family toxin n=1 Tax=Hongsoonwoonella zoysiae TaxID=2821844 RepID=UPI0015616997|nr:type II toxin-antitoxin system RatA family toxin [Hongsoonwoonella zoysiae]NRG18760.1 type II toxin-antitoxin system RatA family toxin [Hongsoonwoonella zoysiae]